MAEIRTEYLQDMVQVPLAGEGLYAATSIPPQRIFSFFNGVRIHCTRDLKGESSDYRVKLTEEVHLDIPDEFISTSSYSATLAHKACHSFKPNSTFVPCWHPRWAKRRNSNAFCHFFPRNIIMHHANDTIHKIHATIII